MYRIVIKNERFKSIKWIQTIILLMNCLAILAFGYLRNDSFLIIWSAVIASSIVLLWNEKKINKFKLFKKSNFALTGLIWALCGWTFIGNWLMAGIILVLLILQLSLKNKFEIVFSNFEIQIPLFAKKTYAWHELENVVLRDGLLTIDFKSNRLLQHEIIAEESGMIVEEDFNEYCQKQLNICNN